MNALISSLTGQGAKIAILALITATGCIGSQTAEDLPPSPLFLGVAYDVSGSVDERGLPVLTSMHLEQIISILKARGGFMAVGLIDEQAFAPLVRLEVAPVVGRLDERAQRNIQNQKQISQFREEATKQVDRLRNAGKTDINGALARFDLFFNEPILPSHAEKILICISDGLDTGPWRKKSIQLSADVKVFTVGIEGRLAQQLFGDQALRFESIDAAIKHLKTIGLKNKE